MKHLDEFLCIFGDITVAELTTFVLAMFFLYAIYKEIKKFNDAKIAEHQRRVDEERVLKSKIESSYAVTQKYPVYHQESIDIRDGLKKEIQLF